VRLKRAVVQRAVVLAGVDERLRQVGRGQMLRLRAKALKARRRPAYYLLKWALLGGLFYLVFVS
jgi:hypothetical protein